MHGWGESRWYETSSDDSGRRAAEEALAGDPTVVIVAGGDGTVRTVAEAVYETGTPLALLPAGTGNLLARNLGLPLNDVEGSVAAAFTGETRGVDVAVAELEDEDGTRRTRTFLVMAGIGLDAERLTLYLFLNARVARRGRVGARPGQISTEKRRRNVGTDPIPTQIRADRRRCRIVSVPSRSGQLPRKLRGIEPRNEVA